MLVKNEIEIHPNSVEYVNDIFSKYEITNEPLKDVKDPILHLYPVEDTYSKDGELNGHIDALFMTVDVYDTEKMLVWKGKRLHDGILPFSFLKVNQIKIFKDLSTLISLNGMYKISDSFAAMDIKLVN